MTPSEIALVAWKHRRKTIYDREENRLFHNGFGWEQKPEGWHPLGVVPLEAPPAPLGRVKKNPRRLEDGTPTEESDA